MRIDFVKIHNWEDEINCGENDKFVGIKIAKLSGDKKFSSYVTVIEPGKFVADHYHKCGMEHYHIIQGTGEIKLIDVATGKKEIIAVKEHSSFSIHENMSHSLKNTGNCDLLLIFSCPESHLNEDRFLI
jgi:mannose-6-phosphate isomerase-like protein (cupin superfamily)